MKPPFVRSPYNYDTNKASDESGLDTGTEGGAKQSFKDECDINVILKRFGIGYEFPETHRVPEFGDFTGFTNFHDAANAVIAARENFESYPAHIRAKFDNDPGKFHDFAVDPKNKAEMADLGLLTKEAVEAVRIERERASELADSQAAARHDERQKRSAGSASTTTDAKKDK